MSDERLGLGRLRPVEHEDQAVAGEVGMGEEARQAAREGGRRPVDRDDDVDRSGRAVGRDPGGVARQAQWALPHWGGTVSRRQEPKTPEWVQRVVLSSTSGWVVPRAEGPMPSGIYETLEDRITIDPAVCNGKPTIRGKRIAAQTILEFLSAGESRTEILRQYPSLEPEDIDACLAF